MSFQAALITAIAMLVGNAFFVGAEFGLVSARRSSIELLALRGSRAARVTLGAMEQVSHMLAGAQLGVTLCSLIFGAVGEPLATHLLEQPLHNLGVSEVLLTPIAVVIALTLMVYLHVVIGEMVPKNLALAAPAKVALLLTPPLVFIVNLAKPLILALNAIANGSLRLVGLRPRQEMASSFSRDEVAGFVKESHREGLLSSEEEQLLSGALQFDDDTIRSVVIPLDKVVLTSVKPTPAEIEKLTADTGFSRFPVPAGKEDLIGYIHLKDTIQIPSSAYRAPLHKKLIRPLPKVKTTSTLRNALSVMQQSSAHLAKVVNSKGETTGIIALEDVLEELVGEIRDDTRV